MTLGQWLARIEAMHPCDIEMGLERLRPVAARLGVDTARAPVITVAGTNGKGSTVTLLVALARAAGLSVASYTSPHLHRFNERICVNGQPVDDASLVTAFEAVEQARQSVPLTYFEFTTLAALWLFRREPVDLLVLEVGLGGRLDAVNLLDPDVAVVTSVGLDHLDWLGPDRDSIAREKCGIARQGRPLIYGEQDRPKTVDATAAAVGASLCCAGRDFGVDQHGIWVSAGDGTARFRVDAARLGRDNLASACQALALLGHLPDAAAVARVAATAGLPGRAQVLARQGIHWVFDVGHNQEAISRFVSCLEPSAGRTWTVLGMLGDKPGSAAVAALAQVTDHWLLLTLPGPRGQSAAALAASLPAGVSAQVAETPEAAVADILDRLDSGDRVLVLGSFLTVAGVAEALGEDLFASGQASLDNSPL